MICDNCTKRGKNCECVPYDTECDKNFQEKITREQMMDRAIKKLGMEHPWVVALCFVCEWYPADEKSEENLRKAYEAGMAKNWGKRMNNPLP